MYFIFADFDFVLIPFCQIRFHCTNLFIYKVDCLDLAAEPLHLIGDKSQLPAAQGSLVQRSDLFQIAVILIIFFVSSLGKTLVRRAVTLVPLSFLLRLYFSASVISIFSS